MFLFCCLFFLIVSFTLQQGSSIQSYEGNNPAGFLTYQEDNCFHLGHLTGWTENPLDSGPLRTGLKHPPLQGLLIKGLKAFLCTQPHVHRWKLFLLGTKQMEVSRLSGLFRNADNLHIRGFLRVALGVSRSESLGSWNRAVWLLEREKRKLNRSQLYKQFNSIVLGVGPFRWKGIFFSFGLLLPTFDRQQWLNQNFIALT